LNAEGKVLEYVRNNKCAAGTAMLLKVMSDILQIPISEMDHEKYHSEKKQKLSNVCSVFAESEAISYLSHGTPREEILAGTFAAIEDQLVSLLSRIDIHADVILTGGTARNRVITNHLAEIIGYPIHVPESPEMIAAIGAALLGRDAHQRG
jgi:predicted CoA-substrate-specific enzyme activase